jgi:hypothetical protein
VKHRSSFPDAPKPNGHLPDARLHLLDREIIDADGRPAGIVDDLLIDGLDDADGQVPDESPRVTAILTGKILAIRILGGQTPTGYLHTFPWPLARKVGTVVQLTTHADTSYDWTENWLRDHFISRIPGGRHAPE